MPWKESHRVNERMHFVTRIEAGERMTDLCQEYGISRKTGHKYWERYQRLGPQGLFDESRKPVNSPKETSPEIQKLILDFKREKLSWGPRKILHEIKKKHPGIVFPASATTLHLLFDRHGLVKHRRCRNRYKATGTPITETRAPNELWCADYKGQFKLGNGNYCYPLTITDHMSRFLLGCEGLENNRFFGTKAVFEAVFQEYGLPNAILSDNGAPFGSVGPFGYSKLSVWLLRLGINIQRIVPGHPEQNGRHERMHLTLKQHTTRPAGRTFLQQQEKFDEFRYEFNEHRPHEALQMRYPVELYKPSQRLYPPELPELTYPLHDLVRIVGSNGNVRFCQRRRLIFPLGMAFSNQPIGLREEDSGIWRVSFMSQDLGFYDEAQHTFEPLEVPHVGGI